MGDPIYSAVDAAARRVRDVVQGRKLSSGGEGTVFDDADRADLVLKIFHKPSQKTHDKLKAMLAHAPERQVEQQGQRTIVQIAWPQEILLLPSGDFAGFTMRKVDLGATVPLNAWFDRKARERNGLDPHDRTRLYIAYNLAAVVEFIHRVGHAIVDIKPENIKVYRDGGFICLLDCDGFSIQGSAERFPALVATQSYSAPEHLAKQPWNPQEFGQAQDAFGLAIMIFMLLNDGRHPADGIAATSLPNDRAGKLKLGKTFIDPQSGLIPPPASQHEFFQPETLTLFQRAFGPPTTRPTALDWRQHIRMLIDNRLTQCRVVDTHWHYGIGCAWCELEKRGRVAATPPIQIVAPITPASAQQASSANSPVLKSARSRVSTSQAGVPLAPMLPGLAAHFWLAFLVSAVGSFVRWAGNIGEVALSLRLPHGLLVFPLAAVVGAWAGAKVFSPLDPSLSGRVKLAVFTYVATAALASFLHQIRLYDTYNFEVLSPGNLLPTYHSLYSYAKAEFIAYAAILAFLFLKCPNLGHLTSRGPLTVSRKSLVFLGIVCLAVSAHLALSVNQANIDQTERNLRRELVRLGYDRSVGSKSLDRDTAIRFTKDLERTTGLVETGVPSKALVAKARDLPTKLSYSVGGSASDFTSVSEAISFVNGSTWDEIKKSRIEGGDTSFALKFSLTILPGSYSEGGSWRVGADRHIKLTGATKPALDGGRDWRKALSALSAGGTWRPNWKLEPGKSKVEPENVWTSPNALNKWTPYVNLYRLAPKRSTFEFAGDAGTFEIGVDGAKSGIEIENVSFVGKSESVSLLKISSRVLLRNSTLRIPQSSRYFALVVEGDESSDAAAVVDSNVFEFGGILVNGQGSAKIRANRFEGQGIAIEVRGSARPLVGPNDVGARASGVIYVSESSEAIVDGEWKIGEILGVPFVAVGGSRFTFSGANLSAKSGPCALIRDQATIVIKGGRFGPCGEDTRLVSLEGRAVAEIDRVELGTSQTNEVGSVFVRSSPAATLKVNGVLIPLDVMPATTQ